MIFVDSNIPMYAIGAEHPNKIAAEQAVDRALADGETLVTDAEAFQEILHRYRAIRRPEAIAPAMTLLKRLTQRVFPIELEDVVRAASLTNSHSWLSARDALHLAILRRYGIARILTFDAGFDRCDGIERLPR